MCVPCTQMMRPPPLPSPPQGAWRCWAYKLDRFPTACRSAWRPAPLAERPLMAAGVIPGVHCSRSSIHGSPRPSPPTMAPACQRPPAPPMCYSRHPCTPSAPGLRPLPPPPAGRVACAAVHVIPGVHALSRWPCLSHACVLVPPAPFHRGPAPAHGAAHVRAPLTPRPDPDRSCPPPGARPLRPAVTAPSVCSPVHARVPWRAFPQCREVSRGLLPTWPPACRRGTPRSTHPAPSVLPCVQHLPGLWPPPQCMRSP